MIFYVYLQITNVTDKAAKCIKDIKVQHKENLVVPFGVPWYWDWAVALSVLLPMQDLYIATLYIYVYNVWV